MARKRKYAFGGNDTDFFNQLADRYAAQYQAQQDQPEYVEQDDLPVQQEQDDTDYQDLQDKYSSLQDKFDDLSNKFNAFSTQDFQGDNFLSFLFGDDNKNPVEFSDEELYNDGGKSSPGLESYKKRGFKTYPSYTAGRQALENQLEIYKSGKSKTGITPSTTLLGAMSIYAPSSDSNNPQHYADVVAKHLGVDINTPISKLDTKGWADAIEQMEGNKYGNNPGNLRYAYGGRIDPNEQIFRYQFGGTPTAVSEEDIVNGLNDPKYAKFGSLNMMLPKQFNPVRGLDNNRPVHVKDQLGHSQVLVGKHDKKYFFGNVNEHML